MTVKLIQQTPNPIETISKIASICYDSTPKDPLKLVQNLYKNGHHSTFEHIYFTWEISGISRACSHQLVRHRLCSFTQRSQRYCDEDNFEVIVPPSLEDNNSKKIWNDAVDSIKRAYSILRDSIPQEDARFLLPNACATKMYLSCNLRELIHMSNERLCDRAQWEIRELVQAMCDSTDPQLHWMFNPKCQSGFMKCVNSCGRDK